MSDELVEALAALTHTRVVQPEVAVEVPAHAPGHNMAVPEPPHDSDAVFAQQDREASVVAGWLALWGGSLLLKDIAQDTFSAPADEEDDRVKTKPKSCC